MRIVPDAGTIRILPWIQTLHHTRNDPDRSIPGYHEICDRQHYYGRVNADRQPKSRDPNRRLVPCEEQ